MKRDKEKNNWSQEAGNIAKFLFYMDPTTPSLDFVRDIETTRRFFRELADVGLQKQTLANYLKSVKAFVRYSVVATSLSNTDPGLYTIARQYLEKLDDITSTLIKQVSKEVVGKRHTSLTSESLTPADCIQVLTAAEPRFQEIFGSAISDGPLATEDMRFFLYYLEALRRMQRPSVIRYMTVEEWCIRKEEKTSSGRNMVIGVKEHKTGAQAVATIALDEQEESWMDVYYRKIRPEFLKNGDPEKEEEEERFFISSSGSAIYNPCNDLSKFQKRLNVPLVNSRTARRVTEMLIGKEKRPPRHQAKKIRESVVRENEKFCYDKWRSVQQELRIRDVIAQFPCRRPSERQIQRYIDRQDWLTNKITAEQVVPAWKPAEQLMEVLDSTAILKLVRSQKWKGLIVKDDEVKGKTVMTTRVFAKDEVVCDYHGIPISKAEGKKLLVCTGQDEMGYLLFYKNSRGQGCCIGVKNTAMPMPPRSGNIRKAYKSF
ncbi:hypothetical protein UPYG_G00056520 [Umbra pygmaea]|uniref:Core-binding (CB) domain-containing protein n=1 Tax=Umbra pygmaea TaxID=75934 RepID=A0ABD0XBH0_UMBPY